MNSIAELLCDALSVDPGGVRPRRHFADDDEFELACGLTGPAWLLPTAPCSSAAIPYEAADEPELADHGDLGAILVDLHRLLDCCARHEAPAILDQIRLFHRLAMESIETPAD